MFTILLHIGIFGMLLVVTELITFWRWIKGDTYQEYDFLYAILAALVLLLFVELFIWSAWAIRYGISI